MRAYPSNWLADANPHGDDAARRAPATLRAAGVLASRRAERVFDACLPELLGAFPFPRAPAPALATITTFLANWALYDDTIEATGEPEVARAAAALRGDLAPATLPPFFRAFAAVGASLRGVSPAWRHRFSERFADTTRSVDTERALRARLATAPPSVAELLAWRRVNIGVLPVLSLIELELGRELGPVGAHPLVRVIEGAASDAVLAINDQHGVHRDDGLNLVALVAREHDLPIGAAAARVARLHDDAIDRLIDAERVLRATFPTDTTLAAWLDRVHHVISGFAAWHDAAPRYRQQAAAA